jgi:hypothetical protein
MTLSLQQYEEENFAHILFYLLGKSTTGTMLYLHKNSLTIGRETCQGPECWYYLSNGHTFSHRGNHRLAVVEKRKRNELTCPNYTDQKAIIIFFEKFF